MNDLSEPTPEQINELILALSAPDPECPEPEVIVVEGSSYPESWLK